MMAEIDRPADRKFRHLDDAQMHELHSRGWSARQIADEVGCTVRSVSRWRKRKGLSQPTPPNGCRPISAERLEQARRLFDGGASRRDVQMTLGMSTKTIVRHFPGTAWTPRQSGEAAAMSRKLRAL